MSTYRLIGMRQEFLGGGVLAQKALSKDEYNGSVGLAVRMRRATRSDRIGASTSCHTNGTFLFNAER